MDAHSPADLVRVKFRFATKLVRLWKQTLHQLMGSAGVKLAGPQEAEQQRIRIVSKALLH